MDALLAAYTRYVAEQLQLSPPVVRRHELWAARWLSWCEEQGLDWREARGADAGRWLAAWKRDVSPFTLRHARAVAAAFYLWAQEEGLAYRNPFARVRPPRPPRLLPRYLSHDEVRAMLRVLDGRRLSDLRDRAILEVLYSTGCRASELCGMNLEDIDWQRGTVIVRGKGGKERVCYLAASALAALQRYLRWGRRRARSRRQQVIGMMRRAEPLFLGAHGRRLSRQAVLEAVKRAARRAGLQRRVWTHLLRHTMATHLRMAGAPIDHIQRLLGHASLSTTQIYTHVADPDVERTWRTCHPLAAGDVRAPGAAR